MPRQEEFVSPLDVADSAFRALTKGPAPLSVNGRRIRGLPARRIRLDELQRILLRRQTHWSTRDAAWTVLVRRARHRGPSWTVAAVGLAMPGLRRTAGRLARGYHGDTADLDAEILTGFLAALRSIDISRPRIVLRLCWAAHRAGVKHRYSASLPTNRHSVPVSATAPPRPWGHPDLVLFDAVAANILTAVDADLIARTRLEHVPLTRIARELHIPYEAARKRRSRAELRLMEAITNEEIKSHMSGFAS